MVVRHIKLWKRREYLRGDARRFAMAGFPRIVSLPLEGKVPRRGGIGHWRYERERGKRRNARHMWGKRESLTANDKDFSLALEMTIQESDVS